MTKRYALWRSARNWSNSGWLCQNTFVVGVVLVVIIMRSSWSGPGSLRTDVDDVDDDDNNENDVADKDDDYDDNGQVPQASGGDVEAQSV